MMFQSTFFALLILQLHSSASTQASAPSRRLPFEEIVGVADHAAIDLDQRVIELSLGNLINASSD
jgi:hypothetical protein